MDDLKYKVTASGRTDEELFNVIDNRAKYLPETIEASVAELQYRKQPLSDEFLKTIEQDLDMRRANAAMSGSRTGYAGNNYKSNLVEDPDAPAFYSRRVIYVFSFVFGTLFGSILLAININKTNNPARMLWVVLFGLVYSAFSLAVSVAIGGSGSGFGIVMFIVGAYALEYFFWNRFIGNTTFYRARPIWIPLIIGIVELGLFFAFYFYRQS